jgi:hypothetical protein
LAFLPLFLLTFSVVAGASPGAAKAAWFPKIGEGENIARNITVEAVTADETDLKLSVIAFWTIPLCVFVSSSLLTRFIETHALLPASSQCGKTL